MTLLGLPRHIADSIHGSHKPIGTKEDREAVASGATFLQLPKPDFISGKFSLEEVLEKVESKYLMAALEQANGVKKKAAELLGITFRSIRYRLKKLGIDSSEDESD